MPPVNPKCSAPWEVSASSRALALCAAIILSASTPFRRASVALELDFIVAAATDINNVDPEVLRRPAYRPLEPVSKVGRLQRQDAHAASAHRADHAARVPEQDDTRLRRTFFEP